MRSHASEFSGAVDGREPGCERGLRRSGSALLAVVAVCTLAISLALSGQASAAQLHFKEVFGSAAQPSFSNPQSLAVNTSSGDVLVVDPGTNTITRFNPDGTPANFSALGANVIDGAGGADKTPQEELSFSEEAQIAVDNSGTITEGDIYVTAKPHLIDIFAGTGEYLGQLSEAAGQPFTVTRGVAVDSSGAVYVSDPSFGIHKFVPSANPPVNADFVTTLTPSSSFNLAAGVGPTAGSLFRQVSFLGGGLVKQSSSSSTVDYTVAPNAQGKPLTVAPGSGHVLLAGEDEVTEYDASGATEAVELNRFDTGSRVLAIAVASSGDIYVAHAGGPLEVWGLVPAATAVAAPASNVTRTTATLNGSVNAEGLPVTECRFEYGTEFKDKAPCSPPAAQLTADFSNQAVNASLAGLQESTTYRYRLTVTDAIGTETSTPLSFTTSGPPQVREVRARDADQTSATIEAKVDPRGFGTTYRIEWGPTGNYGHQVPAELEPFVGEGHEPIRVNATLTGLSAASTYHYRIVATSSAGTAASPDRTLETLDSCGLPEGRCFELVSRREVGPVAIPGEVGAEAEMHYQAATEGPGALAYAVEAGYPEATRGAEVLYRGTRGPDGWQSTQLSTPIVSLNERTEGASGAGQVLWLSNSLSCGFTESTQPLTDDPSMRLVLEDGGTNLYRINPDNSYTPITTLAPENSEGVSGKQNYSVVGASQDCHKVVFSSRLRYPGIPGGEIRLYEWEAGTLRNVGVVPGPSGEVVVQANSDTSGNTRNPVSEDGSRVFFSAIRQAGPNPAEIGKKAVFVREDGTTTRDVSLSETSMPDKEATYQWASPDGSRVFFTANAGLTDESSPEGTDLYMYDLESEELTDLTPYQGEGGAEVEGFIGAAEDGSHAYFLSRNQLVPGKGPTLAENQSAETYSVYGATGGQISFVGTIAGDIGSLAIVAEGSRTSQVSPDGRYLVFESTEDVTGYQSGGPYEAYLYDAQGGSEGTVCVSCRPDGQPSVAHTEKGYGPYHVLPSYEQLVSPHPAQVLISHGDKAQVFFSSPDKLAPGAVEGQNNVYEWSHGQVFRLASAKEGQQGTALSGYFSDFAGATSDGSDVYLYTPETLNWEDGDERISVYDARIGGGFPEPPAPPAFCDATTEGSCQGSAQGGPAVPGAASAAFSGPGNPAAGGKQKKKAHKKKHAKKKHRRHGKRGRGANVNRRAGK